MNDYDLLIPIFLPILAGVVLFLLQKRMNLRSMYLYVTVVLLGTACFVGMNLFEGTKEVTLFYLLHDMPIYFKLDELGKVFSLFVTMIWIAAGIYGFSYMKEDSNKNQYFASYLAVYGVLLGSYYAGNIVTFYVFYEFLTLVSTLFVIHTRTREAKMAALKYMFYSFCGAYMILFAIYFIYQYGITFEFVPGNVLNEGLLPGNETMMLLVVFLAILGFGVKAGMFPFHAWLWSAHPVAPAPASAVLSAVIVKTGIIGVIRLIFYVVGPEMIRGTWVQTTFVILSLFTILLGSMLAYREDVLKKRLAYSTISQLSYVLFGIALLSPIGMVGSLLQIVSHAFIKSILFLVVGAIIHSTHKTRVSELRGIGKQMPVLLGCYVVATAGLVGIPPTSGFISKWYLGIAGLESEMVFWGFVGVLVLLTSALLTAGYLFPIIINGFFPGRDYEAGEPIKQSYFVTIPIICLTVVVVALGCFPNPITAYFVHIVSQIM